MCTWTCQALPGLLSPYGAEESLSLHPWAKTLEEALDMGGVEGGRKQK